MIGRDTTYLLCLIVAMSLIKTRKHHFEFGKGRIGRQILLHINWDIWS